MRVFRYLVNRRLMHCLVNLGLVVSICGCGPAAIVDKEAVSLSLLSPLEVDGHLKDTQDNFDDGATAPDYLVLEMENKIARLCGVKGRADGGLPNFRAAISGVAGTLILSTVSFVFDKINDSLKKSLERYTSTYKGSKTDYVYSSWDKINGKEGLNAVTQKHTCLRLTRITETDDDGMGKKEKRVLDFIAQFRMVKTTPIEFEARAQAKFTREFEKSYQEKNNRSIYAEEALRMREFVRWRAFVRNLEYFEVTPLRLAVNGMVAESGKLDESENRKYALSIGLKMGSVWFDKNEGRQNTVTRSILTTQFEFPEDGQFIEYYFKGVDDDDSFAPTGAKPVIFPVIPYSSGFPRRKRTDGSGMTRFEMAVSEVGVPPKALVAAIAIFGKSSDDLAGLVSDALKKKLKLEDE